MATQSGNADCWDGDKRSISDISLLFRQRSFHDSHKWQSSSLLELPCNIDPVSNVSGTTASMVPCASTSITGAKCVLCNLGEGIVSSRSQRKAIKIIAAPQKHRRIGTNGSEWVDEVCRCPLSMALHRSCCLTVHCVAESTMMRPHIMPQKGSSGGFSKKVWD